MRKQILTTVAVLVSMIAFAQSGHIMQGIGAVNMSMGGAATGQPLDINGAIQWNPAAISAFDGKTISLSAGGVFFRIQSYHLRFLRMLWDQVLLP